MQRSASAVTIFIIVTALADLKKKVYGINESTNAVWMTYQLYVIQTAMECETTLQNSFADILQ